MNFVSTVCPHCGKELQIPDDAEQIVCMYCAQPIDGKALLAKPEESDPEESTRLMEEAEALLTDELFQDRIHLTPLKRNTYPEDFKSYEAEMRPAIRKYCLAAAGNEEAAADHFAEVLFNRFLKHFEEEGLKRESDPRFFDYRYLIVAFTVPAILEQKLPAAEKLADAFLAKWNAHYTKNKLSKSSYENINNGFKKKLCYITTAVCTSLGKGDNCEELNTFRRFRDEWLAATPTGETKIREYYLFAPMIVQAIDRSQEKEAVYRNIWDEHLMPCLNLIRSGELQECAREYENMVLELESKWLN
jgi:hypothetical protein